MPIGYNVPTYTENNFSFGPGLIFMGTAGATPSVDVGAITEDGFTVEWVNEKRDISQGNPKIPVYRFGQTQGFKLMTTGIEWDVTRFSYAIGAGATTSVSASDTLTFGGDPIVKKVAIKTTHQMAVSGHTMNAYFWTAVSDGGLSVKFGQDEHQFGYAWTCLRATANWGGTALARGAELGLLERLKT